MTRAREYTAAEDNIILSMSRREAARLIGITVGMAQARRQYLMDPEGETRKRAERLERRRLRDYAASGVHRSPPPRIEPSPLALEERERRLALQHTSVGAMLMGDPLPGYSALDRRR